MTDDLMDERLRAAGARWRDANPAPAQAADERGQEFEILPAAKKRQRWVSAVSAAIVAAAVVIGGAFVISARDHRDHHKPVVGAASALDGTWALTDEGSITLAFADGQVKIDDGCLKETRRVSVQGDRLTFGSVVGDATSCGAPSERMNQVEAVLEGTVTWQINDAILTLTKSGSTLLYARTSGPRANLIGTTWWLATLTDREGRPVAIGGNASLRIDSTQKLSGSDGCNTLVGTVRVTLHSIEFGDVATTAMGCTDDAVNATAAVLDPLLTGTVTYSIDRNTLVVSKTGVGRATYLAAPTATPTTDPSQLVRVAWTLTQTEHDTGSGNSGSASGSGAISLSVLTFDGNGGFTVKHKCYTNKGHADLGTGTATLTGVALELAVPCASNAESTDGQHENTLVDDVLTGTVAWAIRDGNLTVTKGGDVLTFARYGVGSSATSIDPAALIGKRWVITTIEHGTGPSASVTHASVPIEFSFDGKGMGRDSAGDSGPVVIGNGRLTFGSWSNDLNTGHPHLTTSERGVVQAVLSGTVTWTITGSTLTITKTGVGTLVFTQG